MKCDEMWAMLYSWLDVLAFGCIDQSKSTAVGRWWLWRIAGGFWAELQQLTTHCNRGKTAGNTSLAVKILTILTAMNNEQMLLAMNKWRHRRKGFFFQILPPILPPCVCVWFALSAGIPWTAMKLMCFCFWHGAMCHFGQLPHLTGMCSCFRGYF